MEDTEAVALAVFLSAFPGLQIGSLLAMGFLTHIHMGGLIGVICKEGVQSSGCLLDHPLPLGWLLLSQKWKTGQVTTHQSSPTVTLSFQAN